MLIQCYVNTLTFTLTFTFHIIIMIIIIPNTEYRGGDGFLHSKLYTKITRDFDAGTGWQS